MFKVGDKVKAKGNYRDEQLGEFAPSVVQQIVEVRAVTLAGTSGQWVKTDIENDWIDAAWFSAVEHSVHPTVLNVREIEVTCQNCGHQIKVELPESHSG